MTYKELLELYKSGEISDEQKEDVEKDIEKHSAISEYLFDVELEGLGDNEDLLEGIEVGDNNEVGPEGMKVDDFTKFIRSSIRRTFIKAGIIIGSVVLVIVCFIIFAVPKIKDAMYYNPAKIVGTNESGIDTNQMSLDMAVYSEMFLPGIYRDKVIVNQNGNAKYDICIKQHTSYSGHFNDVGGTINKGEMLLFDSNILKYPAINNFQPADNLVKDSYYISEESYEIDREEALNMLDELNGDEEYVAYVTLNCVMDYDEFMKWEQDNDVSANWCKLCFVNEVNESTGEIIDLEANNSPKYKANQDIGFIPLQSCSELYFDEKNYPLLTQFSLSMSTAEDKGWVVSKEDMTTHVTSMLRYFANQDEFCELMEIDTNSKFYEQLANDVEKNGLNIYAFTMIADKESICSLRNIDEIEYICTSELKYE